MLWLGLIASNATMIMVLVVVMMASTMGSVTFGAVDKGSYRNGGEVGDM